MTDSKLAKQAVLPRRALYKPALPEAGLAPIRKAAKKKKAKKR